LFFISHQQLQPYNYFPCTTFDPFKASEAEVDCFLLRAIGALELLASRHDVSQAIYSKAIQDLLTAGTGVYESKGVDACRNMKIDVDAEFNPDWYIDIQNPLIITDLST